MANSVKISSELFTALVKYHLCDIDTDADFIKKELSDKLDSLVNRKLYSEYKTAPTEEQREAARQKYLDSRGVPEEVRW